MADEETENEVARILKTALKRSPFIVRNLERRRGADVFDVIARAQARQLLKRWDMARKPPLGPHSI